MREIIAATNNQNKLREITAILKDYKIVSLRECGIFADIAETGATFYENAYIKAKFISDLTGKPALADDSGLSVGALGGAPGVYSARYAGEPCDDKKNNEKLLREMEGITDRAASFISVVAVCFPSGGTLTASGEATGVILDSERGTGGFGYDPLFLSSETGKTFAEMSFAEKNAISHRARALNKIAELLARSDVN